MINCRFWNDDTAKWGDSFAVTTSFALPTFHDTFDESLSEVTEIVALSRDMPYTLPIKLWTKCNITFDDISFVGFISAYHDEIYEFGGGMSNSNKKVSFNLIELIAVTQYMPMSNLCFTNTIDSVIDANGQTTTTITTRTAEDYIARISNQLYTLQDSNRNDAPFKLSIEAGDWWRKVEMPEMTFTEPMLFDVLKQIGEVVGGFPYLEFVVAGEYELHFQKWDDPNQEHWQDTNPNQISHHASIENQGEIVDCTIKNVLSVSQNGDNAAIFPAIGGFKSQGSETLTVEVNAETSYVELPKPIYQILEVRAKYVNKINETPDRGKEKDITALIVEFDYWKTLHNCGLPKFEYKTPFRDTRMYYTIGDKKISGISNAQTAIKYFFGFLDNESPKSARYVFQIKYIPMTECRVQMWRDGAEKPIGQIINQEGNIVSATAMSSYLQGLANRIHGEYTIFNKRVRRGERLFKSGEWLNGEIIVDATHQYTTTEVISQYTTSKDFNRRTQFIKLPHNLRQWEIPSGDKVSDRNLLVAEEIQVSIGQAVEPSNGMLNDGGILEFLINYNVAKDKPNLAYVAWKPMRYVNTDSLFDSRDYALATLTTIPFGKSIQMNFEAFDNASIGNRTYAKDPDSADLFLQSFVAYDEKANYLNFKISNKKPTVFDFEERYTGVAVENGENKSFEFTFPLSNKKQFENAEFMIQGIDYKIEKDLSEKIIFNYLLNFVGKNGTIVYEQSCATNSLCNSKAIDGFKLYVSATESYGTWDKVGRGQQFTANLIEKSIVNNNGRMRFKTAFDGKYSSLAITDLSGNLLFATNVGGTLTGGIVDVYMSNRRKKWKKI